MGLRVCPARLRRTASIVAAVAGVSILWSALQGHGDPERMAPLVRALRGETGPRDLVLIARNEPSLLRPFGSVAAVATASPPIEDLAAFRHLYVIDANRSLRTALEARFGRPQRQGRLLAFAPQQGPQPTFDALRDLASAKVSRGGQMCPRAGSEHRCPGTAWRRVRSRRLKIGGAQIDCLFAHPSTDGLRIVYPVRDGVRWLRGAAGLADKAAQSPSGAPVAVRIGNRTHTFRNRRGLHGFSQPVARGAPLEIDIAVESQGSRAFCVMLWGFSQRGL